MGKALVVYESMWGNTEQVARAVADGLASWLEVEVCEVGAAPAAPPPDVDLLVVGGPTHAFSMSRASTRQDARRRGAVRGDETGLREWLAELPTGRHPQRVATSTPASRRCVISPAPPPRARPEPPTIAVTPAPARSRASSWPTSRDHSKTASWCGHPPGARRISADLVGRVQQGVGYGS